MSGDVHALTGSLLDKASSLCGLHIQCSVFVLIAEDSASRLTVGAWNQLQHGDLLSFSWRTGLLKYQLQHGNLASFSWPANWTLEEPAAGLPVEYASIDIPGTCGLEAPYVPESGGGHQQLVEYYYYSASAAAASRHNVTSEKAGESQMSSDGDVDGEAKISNDSHARSVVKQVVGEFKADIDMMVGKMHRYPACLGAVDKCYSMPRIVAIGPYHHGLDHLMQVEKVKHAAACLCVKRSGRLLEELYEAVASTSDNVRHLYDKDVMAGIGYDDFRCMMFFDACFLVQYMLMRVTPRDEIDDESLHSFLSPNRIDIFHDVMLLENQLPWKVVETVMSFMSASSLSKRFVRRMRHCMMPDYRHELPQRKPFIWYEGYRPPHLLGLLRYYIVGRSDDIEYTSSIPKNISISVSAMELAEIGIKLTANKTMELADMRLINQVGTLFAELSLPPLSLDRDCASHLVNMAALELCMVKSFSEAKPRYSAVCSYLLLLAMLVYRVEDVHELRLRGLLVGGSGLTNEEALRFFTSFQGLRLGSYYYHIMVQIERYRDRSRMKTMLLTSFHNHKKTIAAVVSGIGVVATIIGTLVGMLVRLKSLKA
ncbi:hypothetical protein BAE44_0010236 [Dichanthelium oligosanthes]|uniref:Uncharacterized protein n=1 Tax=Dichanthelium oligosanthes TaxID=888268 RepID=A0A1E5VUF3_9POAL|nr:hypothetical protein BAE44_0010236 [Dichanthelium oligosanthes]